MSGMSHLNWEVYVINHPLKNAFVLPGKGPLGVSPQLTGMHAGGKVFVFTGILPVAQTEDGLAAVIGHEVHSNSLISLD